MTRQLFLAGGKKKVSCLKVASIFFGKTIKTTRKKTQPFLSFSTVQDCDSLWVTYWPSAKSLRCSTAPWWQYQPTVRVSEKLYQSSRNRSVRQRCKIKLLTISNDNFLIRGSWRMTSRGSLLNYHLFVLYLDFRLSCHFSAFLKCVFFSELSRRSRQSWPVQAPRRICKMPWRNSDFSSKLLQKYTIGYLVLLIFFG